MQPKQGIKWNPIEKKTYKESRESQEKVGSNQRWVGVMPEHKWLASDSEEEEENGKRTGALLK